MTRTAIIVCCAVLLAACTSVPPRIASLPSYEPPTAISTMKVPYPILLLHGLGQKSHVWDGQATSYFSDKLQLSFGGHLHTQGPIASPEVLASRPSGGGDADYYIMSFRNPYDSIAAWRNELDAAVAHVLRQTGADKVILIGYSMGGLAARAYMTNRLTDHHVKRLITIGTPHLGSVYARVWSLDSTLQSCSASSNPLVSSPCKGALASLRATQGEAPYGSAAIRDLRRPEDDGWYLKRLGKLAHPLDVEYVSVIGEIDMVDGTEKLSTGAMQEFFRKLLTMAGGDWGALFEPGDGVVSARSQNIMNIEYFNVVPSRKRATRQITVGSVHVEHLQNNFDVQRASLEEKPEFMGSRVVRYGNRPLLLIDVKDHIPMLCTLSVTASMDNGAARTLDTENLIPQLVHTREGITARFIVPLTDDDVISSKSVVFRFLLRNTFGYTISGSLDW